MKKITKETEYSQIMSKIDDLMTKGSEYVSKEELDEIRNLAEFAQEYEQSKYEINLNRITPPTP